MVRAQWHESDLTIGLTDGYLDDDGIVGSAGDKLVIKPCQPVALQARSINQVLNTSSPRPRDPNTPPTGANRRPFLRARYVRSETMPVPTIEDNYLLLTKIKIRIYPEVPDLVSQTQTQCPQ